MDYQFPAKPAVSASCKDLLARILVAHPVQRLSIQQIYEHPWFKQGFPKQVQCISYPSCLTSTRYPDDKIRRYLVYLKYWTLNLRSIIVYPKVLFHPNFIITDEKACVSTSIASLQASQRHTPDAGRSRQLFVGLSLHDAHASHQVLVLFHD